MDKKPLESKKFVAWLISMFILSAILIIGLVTQQFNLAMTAFMSIGILGIDCLALGYILSQRKLDSTYALMGQVLAKEEKSNDDDSESVE